MNTEDMDMEQFGLHLGYPECCVESFIDDVVSGGFLTRGERKLSGTGFVPCAKCDECMTEEQLKNKINENRKHPTTFPDHSV